MPRSNSPSSTLPWYQIPLTSAHSLTPAEAGRATTTATAAAKTASLTCLVRIAFTFPTPGRAMISASPCQMPSRLGCRSEGPPAISPIQPELRHDKVAVPVGERHVAPLQQYVRVLLVR